jgi:hypothetical protein
MTRIYPQKNNHKTRQDPTITRLEKTDCTRLDKTRKKNTKTRLNEAKVGQEKTRENVNLAY